jgi:hypothetical protein
MEVRTFKYATLLVAAMGRKEASTQNATGDTQQSLDMTTDPSTVIGRDDLDEFFRHRNLWKRRHL